MQSHKESYTAGVLEPHERLRALTNFSSSVEIDPSVPPRRYYRSGLEMVRMANVYLEEGSLEHAYILYLKFMTLFLEKIRKHPDFASVPVTEKAVNQVKLREVLPKAEKLKARLLEQFTRDYEMYMAEVKQREREEEEQRKKEKENDTRSASNIMPAPIWPSNVQPAANLSDINYPDDNLSTVRINNVPAEPGSRARVVSLTPSIDRSLKPNMPSTTILNTTVVKSGLRTVVTPAKVMTHFLTLSQKNTFNNIETCGILAGKLERHHLVITHVILPKQKGTSDSCTTMNEEEIFEYQDQHNLITIGWIHTHPTQTAFLSSVDLHTHCPYQLLMPEAIAVVCAPKYDETGFFILTPTYGLQYIANCKKSGFHPHPTDPPLFMTAEHVKVDGNAPLEVLDLR